MTPTKPITTAPYVTINTNVVPLGGGGGGREKLAEGVGLREKFCLCFASIWEEDSNVSELIKNNHTCGVHLPLKQLQIVIPSGKAFVPHQNTAELRHQHAGE